MGVDPIVTVDPDVIRVSPGALVKVTVHVVNGDASLVAYRLDVLGEPADWAQVAPTELSVPAGQEGQAVVYFSPPAGLAASEDSVPFAVRVMSVADPSASAVAEGDLVVAGRVVSPGGWRGWLGWLGLGRGRRGWFVLGPHRSCDLARLGQGEAPDRALQLGRFPLHLLLDVSDPFDRLRIDVTPEEVDLPIGSRASAQVRVRPRQKKIGGEPVSHPFRADIRPTGEVLEATFVQQPLLNRITVLVGVVVVLALGGLAWFFLLRGDPETAAPEPPATPSGLAAQPVSHDAVRLTWDPQANVESYSVFAIDPGDAGESAPTATDEFGPVAGDLTSFEVTGLEAGTQHCFQLAAARGSASSSRTPAQCADTLQVAVEGGPTDVTVEPVEGGQVRVAWVDGSAGLAEHLVWRNGVLATVAPAGSTEAVLEAAVSGAPDCFQIQARTGETTSELTPEVCLADGSSSTQPEADLGTIAVVRAIPVDDPQAEARANQFRDQLIAGGHAAEVLNTADYPDLRRDTGNFYWVYIGGFPSADEATAYCQANALAVLHRGARPTRVRSAAPKRGRYFCREP